MRNESNSSQVKTTDVLIVGGGPVGLATAWRLAERTTLTDPPLNITVIEQSSFFNDGSRLSDSCRQFRHQYSEAHMSQLVLESLPFWEKLQKYSPGGAPLIERCGSLWFGDAATNTTEGAINAAMEVMRDLNINFSPLPDGASVEMDFPFDNVNPDFSGFYQPDGGIVNLNATKAALYRASSACKNVSLNSSEMVMDIKAIPRESGGFIVTTSKRTYHARKLILTPGPYVNQVLQHLHLRVNIEIWEMTTALFRRKDLSDGTVYPSWFVFQEPTCTSLFYGFPEIAWAQPGFVRVSAAIPDNIISDPDDATGIPSEKSLALTKVWVQEHMPALTPNPEFTSTCLQAMSSDGKEMLLDTGPEWLMNHQDLYLCCAGWSAKFIPLLGEIMAQLATANETTYDISTFKASWATLRNSDQRSQKFNDGKEDGLKLDVAIVGAGASGLYSGYRLKTGTETCGTAKDVSVNIFEASNRIGGRLESIKLPLADVAAELGGMRYIKSQEIVSGLIEKVFSVQYGLESIDFPLGSPSKILFYLRTQRFRQDAFHRQREVGKKFKTNYITSKMWEGMDADEIMYKIIETVLRADGEDLSDIQRSSNRRERWNDVKEKLVYRFPGSPYDGRFVRNIGFWNVIKDQTNQETCSFMSAAGGFCSNTINWNAAEAFPYLICEFADCAVKYKTIKGGYDQLATCLASAFCEVGGRIWTKNTLRSFTKSLDRHYPYVLSFYNEQSKSIWKVHAKHIMLCMPRRSLELLDKNSFSFGQSAAREAKLLQRNIKAVIREPSFKVILGFEYPWWQDAIGRNGRSITDLPLRQCFYFGAEREESRSHFLIGYNDMASTSFWQTLLGDQHEPRETSLDEQAPYRQLEYGETNKPLVEEVMNQIREMHGPNVEAPDPYFSVYRDWAKDPYGAGYHAWHANFNVKDVMRSMRHPFQEENVYICGEAYSEQQGSVEGALCTAEHVMRTFFNLKEPAWLGDYYLGR